MRTLATPVGLLAAVLLGLAAGAMLAEGAVLVPWWRTLAPEAFLGWYADNARRLLVFYGPLEAASGVAALAAAALTARRPGGALFGVAALLAVAVLLCFPLYFQAVNASFEAGTIAADAVPGALARWAAWHWGRTGLGIAAFGAAVLAVRAAVRAR